METLVEIGKQVPSLAVLAVVVFLFLKQMSESRTEYLSHSSEARADYLASLKAIQLENSDARHVLRELIVAVRSLEAQMKGGA